MFRFQPEIIHFQPGIINLQQGTIFFPTAIILRLQENMPRRVELNLFVKATNLRLAETINFPAGSCA
jgi:hypothetical protein